MAKPVRGKACRSKTEGPCSGELNRCLGRAHALPSPLLCSAHSAPPHPAYLFGPTSELLPSEVCLVSGHGKEACSCAYGGSHGRANELRVACIGFRLLSVLLRPCLPLPNIGCSCWAARSPAARAMVSTATRCEPCERRRPRRTTGDGGPSSRGMSRGTPAVTGGGGAHARRAEDQTGRTPFSSAASTPETPLVRSYQLVSTEV